MHQVLAQATDDPDFAPQATNAKQAQAIGKDVVAQVENALRLLKQNQGQLNPADQAMVARLLEHKKTVLAHVQALASKAEGGLRIRVHGDLHLGQVLVIRATPT